MRPQRNNRHRENREAAKAPWSTLLSALSALTVVSCAAWAAEQSSCVVCHSKTAVAYEESVHQRADLTCVDCHGGDPRDMEVTAMSHGEGFKGAPPRATIPQFCASCHADRALMRQYGLSTHQYEDYKTSQHGKAWASGDLDTAVCTDCHGQHRVLPVDDPRSTVAIANIPGTCGRCHADPDLTAKHGLPADVVDQYRGSVHGRAVLKGGSKAAATCASCHGSHAALPPGARDIPRVCAQCHRDVAETLKDNPHKGAEGPISESPCEACHGHHDIQTPTMELLAACCEKCHEPGSKGRERGIELHSVLQAAMASYETAQKMLSELDQEGIHISELTAEMEGAHTARLEAARVQHTLSRQKLEEKTVIIEETLEDINERARHIRESLGVRRQILGGVWVFIGLTVTLLYWKKRRLAQREADRAPEARGRGGDHA